MTNERTITYRLAQALPPPTGCFAYLDKKFTAEATNQLHHHDPIYSTWQINFYCVHAGIESKSGVGISLCKKLTAVTDLFLGFFCLNSLQNLPLMATNQQKAGLEQGPPGNHRETAKEK